MKRPSFHLAHLASLGALFSMGMLSRPAEALDTELGVDLDFVHPISESGVDSGGGGVLRLGKQLDTFEYWLVGPHAALIF